MADITFHGVPAYGWGNGARPTDFTSFCRHVYSTWTSSNYAQESPGTYAGEYRLSIHNLSNIERSGQNPYGTAPNAAIGPGAYTDYAGTCFTLIYPKANRRFAINVTITENASHTFAIVVNSNWYNATTGAVVTDVNYPGWADSATYLNSFLTISGPPCVTAIHHNVPGIGVCYGIALISFQEDGGSSACRISGRVIDIDAFTAKLQELYPTLDFSEYEVNEVSDEAGPASVTGGYQGGSHDIWTSDSVGVPELPSLSGCDLGFVNMYMPQAGDLIDLGEEIFPDFDWQAPTGNDVVDAIINVAMTIPNIVTMFTNSKLIDYVQDVHIIPVRPVTGGNEYVKLGFRTMTANCAKITSDYVEKDLGKINIKETEGQFMDYLPYTKAKLYLPFVGFVPVEPEYWQNGWLGVVYHFNVRDGSFMAYVTSTPTRVDGMVDHVIGQYSGNACIHIPITGLNYSSMVSGIIGGAAATMVGAASSNPAAAAMAALNTAAAAPQVQYSNSYNGSAAFMGSRVPFLMIERTVSHYPEKYAHDKGIPSRITTNLGAAKGFVTVKDVDLNVPGFRASKEEKDEIRKLLSEGIYV